MSEDLNIEEIVEEVKAEDIDKSLLLLDELAAIGVIFKLAYKDKKIDFKDGMYGFQLLQRLPQIISVAKSFREIIKEGKDIDPNEAIQIVAKLYEIGQKIEQA